MESINVRKIFLGSKPHHIIFRRGHLFITFQFFRVRFVFTSITNSFVRQTYRGKSHSKNGYIVRPCLSLYLAN